MNRERQISVALGRRRGASVQARERMAAADAEALWRAHCRHCDMDLKGSQAELLKHRCPEAPPDGQPG